MDLVEIIFINLFLVSRTLGLFQPSTLIFRHQQSDIYQGSFKSGVFLVDGYEAAGTYERHVHYIASGLTSAAEQLAGLPIASAHCEQFIKYECRHSIIFHNGDKYGWWISRDSEDMIYWGGATPADNYKCACGLTNSCLNPSYGCNCDANDNEWQEDSGFLTEKSNLQVLQLRFGDTGSSIEKDYHTLGKFKCYGNA